MRTSATAIALFCLLMTTLLGCNQNWRRVEQNDFPWNGPNSRAAKYQKTTYDFLYTSTEERWGNADGEMVPYWATFSNAIECLRKSDLLKRTISDSKSNPEATTWPYHFYLVSIDPEIIIVSEQEPRQFDYYDMVVLPSTRIPQSKSLYWFQPDSNPEPGKIKLNDDGIAAFNVQETRIKVKRNADKTIDITRASR